MLKRIVIALVLVAIGAGGAALVFSAIILPSHQAVGQINTAVSVGEGLYICQPDGSTVSPICPIDTDGADETIFAASEDLLPGEYAWQKLRLRNVGSDPWDLRNVAVDWTELSDPGNDCGVLPSKAVWRQFPVGFPTDLGGTGPGIMILGKIASTFDNPVDSALYDGGSNDNHSSLEGTQTLERRVDQSASFQTIHVAVGDYDDVLLGIRLPPSTPNACLDVVWQLTTTFTVQLHPVGS